MAETIGSIRPDKIPTGIAGFDVMSAGGLPLGRVTAVIGAAGTGKTVFAMQAMLNMIRQTGRTGLFISFEQSPRSALSDMNSFDWDVQRLVDAGQLLFVDGRPDPDMMISGGFDIGGLLSAIEGAGDSGAPPFVVLDGIDALLTILDSHSAQRGELVRLQSYVESHPGTVIVTVKASPLRGAGFEEMALYMADCVVELSRDAEDGFSTRGVAIQKYRSSAHAQGRVAFVMTASGIVVDATNPEPPAIPVSTERLPTGIARLDTMLGGGLFRGSSTLLSGAPGTAKTTLGTRFLAAVCERGERALGISFDEAPKEIVRNVASVCTDLSAHLASGLLRIHGMADRSAGPDEFVHEILDQIRRHAPRHVMIDPISIFTASPSSQSAVRRLTQFCKREGITVVLTSLLERNATEAESSRSYVSTLCDNWIHLSYVVNNGERNRALTIVKSRGTAHSNQVGELLLDSRGITIADAYVEDGAVLMGSLRWQKERANHLAAEAAEFAAAERARLLRRSIEETERRIADLSHELAEKQSEFAVFVGRSKEIGRQEEERREELSQLRSNARASHTAGSEEAP
ncbi:circadian clock protein KaiC [Kaistia hirudinis]|uniref:non-specific serine/threonine protein kinase n=1 Tax=Kaistia hirudinis TaxID=1293440 RepID=A0A840ARC4_9HYPH|nr:circadian clock protein KaiC [Kaistia hirudinis]MBB3930926.1 circadian clock protein KaiC [Kaistia hirudinis]